MKPKLLLPIVLLSTMVSSAQFSLKIKLGGSISFFRNNNKSIYGNNIFSSIHERSKAGLLLGVTSEIKINKDISIQPEINYSQRGQIVEDSYKPIAANAGSNQSYKITWHFIDVPVLFKARAHKNFFVEFGPSASFLLNAQYKKETEIFNIPVPDNMTEYYSKIDAGFNCGLAYRYRKFEIGTRYYIGMIESKVKIPNSSNPEIIYTESLPFGKHRSMQFFLAYKLK